MPELLRGMFAFALWDARRSTLLLARDRFGEKPLFYGERPDGFVFASELGALLADERTPATLSLPALDAYLALQYVPSPDTIYEGLKKLPAGHTLELRCGERPVVRRYYRPSFAPTLADLDEREAAARVRATVEKAVQDRLMSDVPLGAFLSGGVDSSIVVACMARATGTPVKTFSIGFSEGGRADNELPFARLVAERYRTDHHELIVAPDMTGLLPSIVRHHGEPFGDSSAMPTYYLCQLARRHVTVALSGDAGDESFGGYRRYVWAHVADLLLRLPRPLPRLVAAALGAAPGGRRAGCGSTARASRPTRPPATCASSAISPPARRPTFTPPSCAQRFARDATAEAFARKPAGSAAPDVVGRLQDLRLRHLSARRHPGQGRRRQHEPWPGGAGPLLRSRRRRAGRRAAGTLQAAAGEREVHPQAGVRRFWSPPPSSNRARRGFALPMGAGWRGACMVSRASSCSRPRRASGACLCPPRSRHCSIAIAPARTTASGFWNLMVLETWFRELVDGRAAFAREVSARADAIDSTASAGPPPAPAAQAS